MGCIAVKIPLTIYEGGTFDRTFQWKSGDPAEAVDLTGFTARMAVRAKNTDAVPVLTVPFVSTPWAEDGATGVYLVDAGVDGKYRIYLKDSDTIGICATNKDIDGVYDLFLVSPAGESVLKQYGVARLIAAVTRTI